MPFRLISTTCLPDDAPTKVDKAAFYIKRFGDEKFKTYQDTISKWANETGIPISFNGVMSQSTRAHRLALKAHQIGGQEMQLPILCSIFKAYLEEAKDIADVNVLAQLAAQAKMMSEAEALKFLQSDELEKEVNTMCEKARNMGITGVPMTIIDKKWAVKGGQSSDVFVQIFKKLAEAGLNSPPSPFAAPVMETTLTCSS